MERLDLEEVDTPLPSCPLCRDDLPNRFTRFRRRANHLRCSPAMEDSQDADDDPAPRSLDAFQRAAMVRASLVDIDASNERFVNSITAGAHAAPWVHVNSYWLQNSRRLTNVEMKLIYMLRGLNPVGVVAFGQHFADEALTDAIAGCGEVIHLVIDEAEQGQGFGRQATELAIAELQADRRYERIVIAHHPDNLIAQALYRSLGFVEFGTNYDGDPLLELSPIPAPSG